MIPKGAKYGNKVFVSKTAEERVRELLDDTDAKTVFLPESISIIDLDGEIINILNDGKLSIVSESRKEKIPAYIFGAEKWSEFAKTWQYTDDDKNIILPIITIRKTETKFGSRLGENRSFISNQRAYEYTRVPVKDKNNGVIGYEIYKIPNPTPIDITYEIRMFSDFSRDINRFDEKFMRQFQDRQLYLNVKGHYMPLFLQGGSDENEFDLEKTNYLVRIYNVTLRGFIIDENDFEIVRANERIIKITEINGSEVARKSYGVTNETIIYGCTHASATNYNQFATQDNGTCTFSSATVYGCTDPSATNYNPYANQDNGTCTFSYPIRYGCTYASATNYNQYANQDDGSCTFSSATVYGCIDPSATNYNPYATQDDGSCTFSYPISGCTDPLASNYNQYATQDDGSCTYPPPTYFISATSANLGSNPPYDYYVVYDTYFTTIEEFMTAHFNITTTNVQDGTILYWNNIGTTSAIDFDDGYNSGTIVISGNTANFTRVIADFKFSKVDYPYETIIIELRTTSLSGPIVGTANTVRLYSLL